MATNFIWVPVIGDGDPLPPNEWTRDRGDYRPDVPDGVPWTWDDSAALDLTVFERPPMAHGLMNIGVAEKDLASIPSRVPDDQVPERDKRLVGMVRACRDRWNDEPFLTGHFDAFPAANAEERELCKALLLQAVARGLSPLAAQRIFARRGLESLLQIGGVDGDLYSAALTYALRELDGDLPAAQAQLNQHLETPGIG